MLEQSVTIKAESVEKAIKMGLSKLNVSESQAEVRVISEGKKGLFGFGKQDAIVEITAKGAPVIEETLAAVTTPEAPAVEPVVHETTESNETTQAVEATLEDDENEEETEAVELLDEQEDEAPTSLAEVASYLERVIQAYGADAKVTFVAKSRQVTFNIDTQKAGLIIGKHGKIIDALQTLAQVLVHNANHRRTMVLINVGDYRDRRATTLEKIAERTANEVLRTKQAVILDPLPAFERKQIHAYLSKIDHIQTHSEGKEPNRYLVVDYVN